MSPDNFIVFTKKNQRCFENEYFHERERVKSIPMVKLCPIL